MSKVRMDDFNDLKQSHEQLLSAHNTTVAQYDKSIERLSKATSMLCISGTILMFADIVAHVLSATAISKTNDRIDNVGNEIRRIEYDNDQRNNDIKTLNEKINELVKSVNEVDVNVRQICANTKEYNKVATDTIIKYNDDQFDGLKRYINELLYR